MSEEYTGKHYVISHSLRPKELYIGFPTKKYITITPEELALFYKGTYLTLYADLFKYLYFLIIRDIILNKVVFKLPPVSKAYIEMASVSGEEFIRARQNGAFLDIDYLASNFTGYNILLRFRTRYGKWCKKIYVSSYCKQDIIDLTNLGESW